MKRFAGAIVLAALVFCAPARTQQSQLPSNTGPPAPFGSQLPNNPDPFSQKSQVPNTVVATGPLTPCTSTGVYDLGNVCNDIYFIGALK